MAHGAGGQPYRVVIVGTGSIATRPARQSVQRSQFHGVVGNLRHIGRFVIVIRR